METEFTEKSYIRLVSLVASKFEVKKLEDVDGKGFECIWRHDVDMSPNRAFWCGKVEQELGFKSYFFFMVNSRFYNLFESNTLEKINNIIGLGHEIGIHFDFQSVPYPEEKACIEECLNAQTNLFQTYLGIEVRNFTIHNPTASVANQDEMYVANLLNMSAPEIVNRFTYCSDSNGYWRHESIFQRVADQDVSQLYALTHPEWWVKEPMTPRQRIQRCIDGRAVSCGNDYDSDLAEFSRLNY